MDIEMKSISIYQIDSIPFSLFYVYVLLFFYGFSFQSIYRNFKNWDRHKHTKGEVAEHLINIVKLKIRSTCALLWWMVIILRFCENKIKNLIIFYLAFLTPFFLLCSFSFPRTTSDFLCGLTISTKPFLCDRTHLFKP